MTCCVYAVYNQAEQEEFLTRFLIDQTNQLT